MNTAENPGQPSNSQNATNFNSSIATEAPKMEVIQKRPIKKILLIVGFFTLFGIITTVLLGYYIVKGGFTKKQRFNNCMETCEETLILESSKQYCDDRCIEITGYNPSAESKTETTNLNDRDKTSTTDNSTSSSQNSDSSNSSSNTTMTGEYYCEWSWPQKVIIKDSKKVVQPCTSDQPWCNKADGEYENVGCCTDAAYIDCITLEEYDNAK